MNTINPSNLTDDEIKAIQTKLQNEEYKRTLAARKAENSQHIGKCFRMRNSYGNPKKSWWCYVKITGIDKSGWLQVAYFETRPDGEFVKKRDTWYWITDHGNLSNLTPQAYAKAHDEFVAGISSMS